MGKLIDMHPGLALAPVTELVERRGLLFAKDIHYGQILVTGPPGSGKSTFVQRLGGWPEEGYIDLSAKGWWAAKPLALRPREVHLGLPFVGQDTGLSLFGAEWLEDWRTLKLDTKRIRIPPPKRHLLSVDWRNRYAFEFLLPPPEAIVHDRESRALQGTHPIDQHIDLEQVEAQVRLYAEVALYLHRQGMIVHLRDRPEDPPLRLYDHGAAQATLE